MNRGQGRNRDARRATIRDVAHQAEVSIASVSAVLNGTGRVGDDTRRRVLQAVQVVNYQPNASARSLRLGRTNLIGMVVGDITNPFCAGLVRVVEKAAIKRGYSVIVCNLDDDDQRLPDTFAQLRSQSAAGMLLSPIGPRTALLEQLAQPDLPPVVTFDQRLPGLDADYVGFDNRGAIRMLVDHLARLGHERIALITGHVGRWTADERYEGFVGAMATAGLPVDAALVVRSGFEGEGAYAAAAAILGQPRRPTAIVAANNTTALGALQCCIDLGLRCPADLSIVGVDDVPWGGLVQPRLTLVAQPLDIMGTVAIEWLLERIEAATPPPSRELILGPTFSRGASCRDIRAGASALEMLESSQA